MTKTWGEYWKDLGESIQKWLIGALPEFGGVQVEDLQDQGFPAAKLALFYMLSFVGCFFGLTWVNVHQLTSTVFLSAQGNSSNQLCQAVPNVMSANFEATYDGYWEGTPNFSQNKSLLVLQFTGSGATNEQYTAAMQLFASKMAAMGAKAATRNLAWSALAYAQYTLKDSVTNTKFFSSADAGIIFNSKVYIAAFSSRAGVCQESIVMGAAVNGTSPNRVTGDLFTSAKYNKGSRMLTVSVPAITPELWIENSLDSSAFAQLRETCPSQILGMLDQTVLDPFLAENRRGFVDLNFDIRSVSMAISLNLGIIDTSQLHQINSPSLQYLHLKGWMDPLVVPEMEPVWCLDKTDAYFALSAAQIAGPEICFLNIGFFYFFYPVMSQLYNSASQKTCGITGTGIKMRYPCKCPAATGIEQYFCQTQDFYVGLLYDQGGRTAQTYSSQKYTTVANADSQTSALMRPPITLGLKFQQMILDDPVNGDITAMDAASEVFAYTALSYNDIHDASTNQSTTCSKYNGWDIGGQSFTYKLKKAWDVLCPWKTCGMLALRLRNDDFLNTLNLPLNKYGVSFSALTTKTLDNKGYGLGYVTQRVCNDMISLGAAMAKLAVTPPVPLIQPYYLCSYTLSAALFSALGSSFSLATLLLTLAFTLFGFFYVRGKNSHILRRDGGAGQSDLLLDKNEKLRLQSDAAHHVISGLVKELKMHRQLLSHWQSQFEMEYEPALELSAPNNMDHWHTTVAQMKAFRKLYRPIIKAAYDDHGLAHGAAAAAGAAAAPGTASTAAADVEQPAWSSAAPQRSYDLVSEDGADFDTDTDTVMDSKYDEPRPFRPNTFVMGRFEDCLTGSAPASEKKDGL